MRFIVSAIVTFFLFLISAPFILAATISLSGGQSSITANDEYNISVLLSIENDTDYYLRGVFYKPNTTHYCGYTWNESSWFKGPYSSSNGWTNFLKVTTKNHSWNGKLKAKIDPSVKECSEGGTYNFKIERFTQSGSSESDNQNEQTVEIAIATPTLALTLTPVSSPTPTSFVSDNIAPTITESVSTETLVQPSPTAIPTSSNNSDPSPTSLSATDVPQSTSIPMLTPIESGPIVDSPTATDSSVISSSAITYTSPASNSVLGLQVEPTSSGLSNDPQSLPTKAGISSGVWYLLFMGGILLMAGCGIVLFQIRRKK